MDPLRLLQATLTAKATVELLSSDDPASTPVSTLSECSHLAFPDLSSSGAGPAVVLPKTTPTRFKRTPQSTATDTWDLQALLLAFLRRDVSIAEYAQEAVQQGVELVGVMQRKVVADYLEGKDPSGQQTLPYLVPEGEPTTIDTSVESTLSSSAVVSGGAAGPGQAAAPSTSASATTGDASTHAAATTATTADGRPAKRAKYVVNKEDLEAYKKIVSYWEPRQIADRNTVLRGNFKLNNFSNVRDLIQDRLKTGKDELRRSMSGRHAAAPVQQAPAQPQQRRRRQANPIIIVSPSSSALITMFNVKRFLEESVYEPADIARANSGRIAEDVIQINHKRKIGALAGDAGASAGGLSGANRAERTAAGEKLVRYFVVDGVDALSKFGDDAWDRVVCVMTTGQEWQFRPYKWTEPKELFHHVKGIHFKLTNEPPNPKIQNWNVTELKIDPVKRYIDKSTVSDFWRILEAWTTTYKAGVVDC